MLDDSRDPEPEIAMNPSGNFKKWIAGTEASWRDQCAWCPSSVFPSAVPPVAHRMQAKKTRAITGTTTNGEVIMFKLPEF